MINTTSCSYKANNVKQMRAYKHGLLELSTVGQGRIKYVTILQTRAYPLVLPVFLSETWHRALPELLNKLATCNKTLI